MINKVLDFIHGNKIMDWFLRNGLTIIIGLFLLGTLLNAEIVKLYITSLATICLSIVEVNFVLYAMSKHKFQEDAVPKIFGWVCLINFAVIWLIFSDILK